MDTPISPVLVHFFLFPKTADFGAVSQSPFNDPEGFMLIFPLIFSGFLLTVSHLVLQIGRRRSKSEAWLALSVPSWQADPGKRTVDFGNCLQALETVGN